MQDISFEDGVNQALNSLLASRLALLAGAGLSMATPSSLPSAYVLAAAAKLKYDGQYGATRAPLAEGIEQQAQFFFDNGELETVYLRTLIDKNAFAGRPNPGHLATADLLLVGGIQTAITTNVDQLIENAGSHLYGQIGAGIDVQHVATLTPDIKPLLKIHGCRSDPPSMVWAPGQILIPPISDRITGNSAWLNIQLLDRDLLIIGYWTDWDYLNEILQATLGTVSPSRVIVIDPADPASFEEKAPNLFALGQRATTSFQHVRASGSDFLDVLRKEFSRSFVRRVLTHAAADYEHITGNPPDPTWVEPQNLDNDILWLIRRDLEGQLPNAPSNALQPHPETLLGLTLLQLQAAGATQDGPYWQINGSKVRVIRAANKILHRVESEFARETAPVVAPDFVVAVGSDSQSLPNNIARGSNSPSITRGSASRWITRTDAVQEFNL